MFRLGQQILIICANNTSGDSGQWGDEEVGKAVDESGVWRKIRYARLFGESVEAEALRVLILSDTAHIATADASIATRNMGVQMIYI
jgi:hypothetical protein